MHHLATILCALLFVLPSASSFEKLAGKRLAKFRKTAAASEAGKNVAVKLPTTVLGKGKLVRFGTSRRLVTFRDGKVEYVISRRDPYLLQALRKIEKNKSGGLLVKGTVVATAKGAKTKRWVVRVKSMQKFGKARRRK